MGDVLYPFWGYLVLPSLVKAALLGSNGLSVGKRLRKFVEQALYAFVR